jgi:DNA-binding response OmpR family regulator
MVSSNGMRCCRETIWARQLRSSLLAPRPDGTEPVRAEDLEGVRMEDQLVILVVDKEHRILELLELLLRANHYVVWSAISSSEAIDIFREQAIGLVLVNVNMPVQTGPELVRELQMVEPNLRFCFMTAGNLGKCAMQDLLDSGAIQVIQKPFSMTALLCFLDEVRHEPRQFPRRVLPRNKTPLTMC